jgi:beta-N-acetylhexosaminidase
LSQIWRFVVANPRRELGGRASGSLVSMVGGLLYAIAVLVAGITTGFAPAAGPVGHPASRPSVRPLVQRLSVQQLAGQRIVYAYAGLRPPASLLAAIRAGEAGGVIFFTPNISSAGQLRSVIDELQSASLASPLHDRLLMLTDQEGGEVRRLPGAPILSEKQIGESPRGVSAAVTAGTGAGRNLRGAGLNVNLAPVLDVFRQSGNFIDEFQRSAPRSSPRSSTSEWPRPPSTSPDLARLPAVRTPILDP